MNLFQGFFYWICVFVKYIYIVLHYLKKNFFYIIIDCGFVGKKIESNWKKRTIWPHLNCNVYIFYLFFPILLFISIICVWWWSCMFSFLSIFLYLGHGLYFFALWFPTCSCHVYINLIFFTNIIHMFIAIEKKRKNRGWWKNVKPKFPDQWTLSSSSSSSW